VANRPAVSVTADADKMAVAVIDAMEKLMRAIDADLGRVKDRNGRETIRDGREQAL
jgi:hypothetical protein